MPTFGKHETDARLHLTGVGGVYALKTDGNKAIKVLLPKEGVWSTWQMRAEVDGFLLRARTQRLVVKGDAKHWAPVHEVCGVGVNRETAEDGAETRVEYRAVGVYTVMDRYDRSVQSLIDSHVYVTIHDLRNIFSGVFRGLLEIRKVLKRGHGAIKASNILLAKSLDLPNATVHLTDPAADGSLSKNVYDDDLAACAKLIYELVNQRPYAGGTIGPSKEWSRLGPNGEDWRKLCGALLDAHAPAEERDLEKILPQMDTWRKEPPKAPVKRLVAAGLLFVLLVGGGIFWFTRPERVDFDQGRWNKLCYAYYTWFGKFTEDLDERTKAKFSSEPYPSAAMALLNSKADKLEDYRPQNIAKKPQSIDKLVGLLTDDITKGAGPRNTKYGLQLIEDFAGALGPEKWPTVGMLSKTAEEFRQRKWLKPARAISELVASSSPPKYPTPELPPDQWSDKASQVDLAARIEGTVKASQLVVEINGRWATIQGLCNELPKGAGVPLLDALPGFAQRFAESPDEAGTLADVQALATSFNQVETVLKGVTDEIKGKEIDYTEFAKDPGAQVPTAGVTPRTYAGFPELARGYVKLPADPTKKTDWTAQLVNVQTAMIEVIRSSNKDDKNLPKLMADHAAVKKQVEVMVSIPKIQKNARLLDDAVAAAGKALSSLNAEGDEWVSPYTVKPAVFLAEQDARRASGPTAPNVITTAAVREEWARKQKAYLDKVRAASAGLDHFKYQDFLKYRGTLETLEKVYAGFDGAIPAKVPGLADIKEGWQGTIAARVAGTDREAALTELMTTPALKWADDLPQVEDAGYVSFMRQRLATYEARRVAALALIADGATIISRLDRLELLADEPAKNAASWQALYGKWFSGNNALLGDAEIANAVKPIGQRAAAVAALDKISDYKGLVDAAGSAAAEVALTAWRKLGEVAVSQDAAVLDDEERIQAHLNDLMGGLIKAGVIDNARIAAIGGEMKAQRPVRWRRWAETLTSSGTIQAALDRRSAFGVTLDPRVDARMVFNEEFYALRKYYEAKHTEPELKTATKAFIDKVNAMAAEVSGDKDVQAMLARLAKPLATQAIESSAAGAGPKLAGWEEDKTHDGVRIFTYTNKLGQKYILEFVKMQVGEKTIYLCTSEMSVGLFREVLNASGKLGDLLNRTKAASAQHWLDDTNPDYGLRTWKVVGGEFVISPSWMEAIPQMKEAPLYPGEAPAPPSSEDPVQVISPWSAMYASRLLGCRLPTSAEWLAAYGAFEQNGAKDAWLLRGTAFEEQENYAKLKAAQSMKFPDTGIFLLGDQYFANITSENAKPWHYSELSKLAPNRFTENSAAVYKTSRLWFRKVGMQPGLKAPGNAEGRPHDLVGNVAEYVFDGPDDPASVTPVTAANAVIKDTKASVSEVDVAIERGKRKGLFVIGGSSLSPPDNPFNAKLPCDPEFPQTASGYSDVGFRLAYTAPIDSIMDVLAALTKDPKYFPGVKAKG